MRQFSTGFLALAAISLLAVGCGSDSKPPASTGSGGSASGTGGTASGTGGSATGTGGSASGTGGSATGTGGTSGSGGATGTGGTVTTDAGTDGPAACITPTATTGLVSDFAGTTAAAALQTGGMDTWRAYPTTATPAPTAAVVAGEMHAESTGPWASLSASVAGFGTCVNLSKYQGVSFKIKSATNTSLIFQVATRETEMASNHYRAQITVTPAYATVMVPFTTLMPAPFGVNPAAGFKPHERAYGLAFGVLGMMEKLDIFLDDITFY